jgi:hypothetical protein
MIPKNIIQLYLGPETDDFRYLEHLHKGWKLAYPEWNHIFLKNEDVEFYIKEYSDAAFDLYSNINLLTYRADLARLILLYKFGGVYLDLDTRPNLPLEQYAIVNQNVLWAMMMTITNNSDMAREEGYRGVFTANCIAVAEKESDFIKEIIDLIIDRWHSVKNNAQIDRNINQFWAAKLVSTIAWGTMLLDKLNELSGEDYLVRHRKLGHSNFGTFWISWDGKNIITKKYRDFVTHIGSILLKDFVDTNPSEHPLKLLSELYSDISLHNGEIKINSRGLHGV